MTLLLICKKTLPGTHINRQKRFHEFFSFTKIFTKSLCLRCRLLPRHNNDYVDIDAKFEGLSLTLKGTNGRKKYLGVFSSPKATFLTFEKWALLKAKIALVQFSDFVIE